MFNNKVIILYFIISILYTNYANPIVNTEQDICLLDKDPGMCRASFSVYYFDKNRKDCFKFIFGGCGSENSNNFNTYKECIKRCRNYI